MKIQALKSFTYVIPEPAPTPPVETLYWINQEVTLAQEGTLFAGLIDENNKTAMRSLFQSETVDVIFNGDTYENVPVVAGEASYVGEASGEDPDFTNYPFWLVDVDGELILCGEAAGTVSFAVIASGISKATLTVTSSAESTATFGIGYFGADEKGEITDIETEAIAAGASASVETYVVPQGENLYWLGYTISDDGDPTASNPVNCAYADQTITATEEVTTASITFTLTAGEVNT